MTGDGDGTLHGVLGAYESADAVLEAVRQARRSGHVRLDAFTPFPVDGLAEALGRERTAVPALVLAGGIAGGAGAFALQSWVSVRAYPLNVGGRPLFSWPSFIPVTFEVAVLVAALAGFLGMLALNGLPRPHHPLFSIDEFARASSDRFFVCVEAQDALFDRDRVHELLRRTGALQTWDVHD